VNRDDVTLNVALECEGLDYEIDTINIEAKEIK